MQDCTSRRQEEEHMCFEDGLMKRHDGACTQYSFARDVSSLADVAGPRDDGSWIKRGERFFAMDKR